MQDRAYKVYSETKLGTNDNEGKNNVLSANKQSNNLHTAVSIAFSYLHQCSVKTGGKTAISLFLLYQTVGNLSLDLISPDYSNSSSVFTSISLF